MNQISAMPPGAIAEVRLRSDAYSAYTLRDLLTAGFFFRRALLLAFLIPLALAVVAAVLSHTVYTAQARLLVLYGSEYVFRPAVGQAGSGIALDRNQIIEGEIQILQSTTLALEVLQQVGIDKIYPGTPANDPHAMDLAAVQFERDLAVTAVPQANVIELAFANRDRDVAAQALRSLIERYLVRRAQIFQKPTPLADERVEYATRLHAAEDALTQFKAAHGITEFDQQVTLLLNQKSTVADGQREMDQAIQDATARLETVRRQLASTPQTVSEFADTQRSQQATGMTDALVRLELQRRALLSRYQDDFPLVQDVDRQIAAMRAQVAGAPTRESAAARSGRNPLYQDLGTQRATLEQNLRGYEARRAELAAGAISVQARLDELNGLSRQYLDLVRARDVLAETYKTFALNSEEASLGDALAHNRIANVRVVQQPEPPPTGRSLRLLLLAAGVLVGAAAAAAALAILNAMRQVFISVHDAERSLDLPVLLAVPRLETAPRGAVRGAAR